MRCRTRMFGLFCAPRQKPTTRLTSDANDFVNAKIHAKEKLLLAV